MYRIQLKDYEGPLDLLLFLIQRDEIDILDIPIAKITDEYLAFVRVMEAIDLDVVADFIYMAALLISVKVRMLLPRPEIDDAGEEVDPRQEIVERLLEYMRYKEVAEELSVAQKRRAGLFTRGQASAPQFEATVPETLVHSSLYDLVGALRRILTEAPEKPTIAFESVDYTVEGQRNYVTDILGRQGTASFNDLVLGRHKSFVIVTFLAILEMAQQGLIGISPMQTGYDFYVSRAESPALGLDTARLN